MYQENVCDVCDVSDVREVKLFKNRRNQAVRIPADFSLDVERVRISREGQRLVIEPIYENKLRALLNSWQALEENFPEIADAPPTPEDIF